MFDLHLFFRIFFGDQNAKRWLDVSPYEHESNGKNGYNSRSWNRAYLRYTDTLGNEQWFHWNLKVWLPFDRESDELQRYRGIAELTATIYGIKGSFWNRSELTFRFYPGGPSYLNPLMGGQELTLRLKLDRPHVLPLIVFQFFHGYGENLIEHQQERFCLRAGIGL